MFEVGNNSSIRKIHFEFVFAMLLKLVVIFGYILFHCTYASDTPTLHTPVGVEGKEKQEEPLVDSAPDLIHGIVKDIDKDQNVISKTDDPKKHILMFHPWGTPSHMNQFKPLIKGLLEAGNMVTALFVRETKIAHEDYKEIIVADG